MASAIKINIFCNFDSNRDSNLNYFMTVTSIFSVSFSNELIFDHDISSFTILCKNWKNVELPPSNKPFPFFLLFSNLTCFAFVFTLNTSWCMDYLLSKCEDVVLMRRLTLEIYFYIFERLLVFPSYAGGTKYTKTINVN